MTGTTFPHPTAAGTVTVVKANSDELRCQEMALRWDVFVVEQECPVVLEVDARDFRDDVIHFVALFASDTPQGTAERNGSQIKEDVIGCVRLIPDNSQRYHLGRLAVRREHRGMKVAAALVKALHRYVGARTLKGTQAEILLHAQTQASGFYMKQGYRPSGRAVFYEGGIEHVEMIQTIPGSASSRP